MIKKSIFKKMLFTLSIFTLLCFNAHGAGFTAVKSSGLLTADKAIVTTAGYLNGMMVNADGTNACTLMLSDNASGSAGTVLWKFEIPAGDAATVGVVFPAPVKFESGIYADVTTTGTCSFIILYREYLK